MGNPPVGERSAARKVHLTWRFAPRERRTTINELMSCRWYYHSPADWEHKTSKWNSESRILRPQRSGL